MGYRSDVAFAVSNKLKTEALIAQVPLPEWCNLPEWGTTEIKHESYSIYQIDGVKWNSDFDCVTQTSEFTYWAENKASLKGGPDWGFLRIGEEYGDVEEHGHPDHFGIYPETSLAIY